MKVWVIRGKYNHKVLEEYYKEHPLRRNDNFEDGQYVYWSRTSTWEETTTASVQVNHGSAKRAFKRAVEHREGKRQWVVDIELVEAELILPNGD